MPKVVTVPKFCTLQSAESLPSCRFVQMPYFHWETYDWLKKKSDKEWVLLLFGLYHCGIVLWKVAACADLHWISISPLHSWAPNGDTTKYSISQNMSIGPKTTQKLCVASKSCLILISQILAKCDGQFWQQWFYSVTRFDAILRIEMKQIYSGCEILESEPAVFAKLSWNFHQSCLWCS